MFKRWLLVAALALVISGSLPGPGAAASVIFTADDPIITGEPTAEEAAEISVQWRRLLAAFPAAADCITPVTVVVVDSAEAAWGGGISGIAAFYRRSISTVYVEHGKVRDEHLIHEFAHHLDFSCGFGSSDLGAAFLEVQGFDASHAWARGSSWRDVPAEQFAEAVVGYLGIDSVDLPVSPEALALVEQFAEWGFTTPVAAPPGTVL